jgi:hypothetical protein
VFDEDPAPPRPTFDEDLLLWLGDEDPSVRAADAVKHFPVILGEEEWGGLLEWLGARALADGRPTAADLDTLRLADGPAEVPELVTAGERRQRSHAREQPRRRA